MSAAPINLSELRKAVADGDADTLSGEELLALVEAVEAAQRLNAMAREYLPEWYAVDSNDEAIDGWDGFLNLEAALARFASADTPRLEDP